MDPYFQVSRDAARALEEFSDEMRSALVSEEANQWAAALGYSRSTTALTTSFPIPLTTAGYKEFKGDMKFRHLYSRSLSMRTKLWQDGVEEYAHVVEAPDFIGWAEEPAAMAREWARLPNQIVADMLALSSLDGPLLDFYTDKDSNTVSTRRLFAADHPFNIFDSGVGSFDNGITTTEAEIQSGAFFEEANNHFRNILAPNGTPMGLRFFNGGSLLVPSTRETLFKKVLEHETLIRAVSNAGALDATSNVVAAVPQKNEYKGVAPYYVGDELADQNHFYVFAAPRPGMYPWVIQTEGSPEEFRHDKDSELYKRQLKIGVAYVGKLNAAAALPHRILRVEITG